jgi:O-antigen ligase
MLPRWNAERWTRSLCGLALIALPLLFSPSWYRIRTGKAAALLLIGSLLAGTCLVFLGRTQRPLWRIPPPIRLPLILLAAWEIGGMAWAIDLQIGLRRILLDLILLAYFGAFFALGDRARHRRFFLILNLVAGLTIALFTLYQKTLAPLWLNSLFSPEQSRPTATFGNPNFLSQYLLAVSVLALGWLLFGKRRTLPLICLATACLLAGFQGILLTRSRASTIALTLCAMVLAGLSIYRRFHRNSRASLVYGLMAVVFAANLFWWPRSFLQRFDPEEISNQFRFQAYSDAFNMILQVPWGIGRGQTEVVFSRYRTPTAEIASWTRASQIHCDPLEWTGELGMVPGLFLGLWLGIALLKWMGENLRKSLEPLPWMAAAGGILANSLVSFPLHNPSPSLFFAMTMRIAAARPPAPGDCPVSSIRPLRHWIVAGDRPGGPDGGASSIRPDSASGVRNAPQGVHPGFSRRS